MEVSNRFVTIKGYIDGTPSESDLEIRNAPLALQPDPVGSDVVAIVKNLYLSVDPYQINRMKAFSPTQKTGNFAARLAPGKPIDAAGVGVVVASGDPEFKRDDLVVGILGWEEYTTVRQGTILSKLTTKEFPLSYHVSILGGVSGLTAYAGFYDICKPKSGEKVFVSAAAGSVGNLVGQFAKLSGCYVVGCAGSQEKVELLKEKLGFDDAFNYKEEPDLKSALQRYFPDGIDIYFDNVGGKMLEAAIANMNNFGRVASCGVVSEYTDKGMRAVPDMVEVVYKRITIKGFLAYDHISCFADFITTTSDHLRNGKIHVLEHISRGLESIPSAFVGLFRGANVGKTLIKVCDL